ncbi:ATP-binding protein [Mesorhizobium sp.]|uniref:ATP-binding protein n=1 Tax=Mesorhizobium sp. TaxID=1871066 RepID=UPI000FE8D635|nr:ATP-binding protein [Mesorhizobium sp.]RWD89444.1 MAG: transcriptional regulator [Mesorhizobium sp.]TIV49085.1 MAG: transcriptional regulator [Mesorhizobium sp.]
MGLANPQKLIDTLCSYRGEREWFEFKRGHFDPVDLGEYISALSNSAMLAGQRTAFVIFGIDDSTHDVVGTNVRLKDEKGQGGEPFENWVQRFLNPRVGLDFAHCFIDGKRVEIMCIQPAFDSPVLFKNVAYIRINSINRRLLDFRELERMLWSLTSRYAFEEGIAATHLSRADIEEQFYCRQLAEMIWPGELSDDNIFQNLLTSNLIIDDKQGGYDVTNLLALCAARDLRKYKTIAEKAHRIIFYKGKDKLVGIDEIEGQTGYVITFKRLLNLLVTRTQGPEIFLHGVRKRQETYPEKSLREFLANVLSHQDFSLKGRPTIEVYSDKIQFTNPGVPLVKPERFIDAPAKSRNEKLSDLMRMANLCEKRGSGIDRAIWAIEEMALPPPLFAEIEGSTVVTIFSSKDFAQMSREERIRACYQHASLRYIGGDLMSNGSLRVRLGMNKNQYPQVSAVIRDAIDVGSIKPLDEDQGNRQARYVPWWA